MKEKIQKVFRSKTTWRIVCLVAAIVSGLQLAIEAALRLWMAMGFWQFHRDLGSSASVGIIGGADGPTAIFLTVRTGVFSETAVAVLVFAVSIFFYIRLGRKK